MKAKEAITAPAITVTPETRCKDAAGLLVRHRISALPVVDADRRLVGLVSEADLLPLETTPDPRSQAMPLPPRSEPLPRRVDEVMTPEVYTVEEETDLGLVAQRMLEANVKRFPVMRGERLVGIISRHDQAWVSASVTMTVSAARTGALTVREGQGLRPVSERPGAGTLVGDGRISPAGLGRDAHALRPGL